MTNLQRYGKANYTTIADTTCTSLKVNGCSTNSANTKHASIGGIINFLFGVLFLSLITGVVASASSDTVMAMHRRSLDAQVHDSQVVQVAYDATDAIDQFYAKGNHSDTTTGYLCLDTMTYVTEIIFDNSSSSTNEGQNMAKRFNAGNAPLGTHFHQYQVVRNGYWDTPWKPVSGCDWTGLGDGGDAQLQWSETVTSTLSVGFNIKFSETIQANWGIQISNAYSQGGSYTCHIPPGKEVGQIWASKGMAWHDQQKQSCVRVHYGRNGLKCGHWGPYIHGDMPTRYGYNLGCSTGRGNVQC